MDLFYFYPFCKVTVKSGGHWGGHWGATVGATGRPLGGHWATSADYWGARAQSWEASGEELGEHWVSAGEALGKHWVSTGKQRGAMDW